jgi:hypothetical protein
MAKFEGKCPHCGKVHYSDRGDDVIVCDCWRYCPLCGAEMTHYMPDLAPRSYSVDGKQDFAILRVCLLHSPPFYSSLKPVEVVFTYEAFT